MIALLTLFRWFWVVVYAALVCQEASGQTSGYYANEAGAPRAFWSLKTDYAIHGSVIRFFSADSQLVYQETLPNQFIKLTPQNVRKLDQTLARLVENQLVAQNVSVSPLPTDPAALRKSAAEPQITNAPTGTFLANPAFRVECHLPEDRPALHLLIQNTGPERLVLQVRARDRSLVYEHTTRLASSRHHINFSGMPAGIYRLSLKSLTGSYQEEILVNYQNGGQAAPTVSLQVRSGTK